MTWHINSLSHYSSSCHPSASNLISLPPFPPPAYFFSRAFLLLLILSGVRVSERASQFGSTRGSVSQSISKSVNQSVMTFPSPPFSSFYFTELLSQQTLFCRFLHLGSLINITLHWGRLRNVSLWLSLHFVSECAPYTPYLTPTLTLPIPLFQSARLSLSLSSQQYLSLPYTLHALSLISFSYITTRITHHSSLIT